MNLTPRFQTALSHVQCRPQWWKWPVSEWRPCGYHRWRPSWRRRIRWRCSWWFSQPPVVTEEAASGTDGAAGSLSTPTIPKAKGKCGGKGNYMMDLRDPPLDDEADGHVYPSLEANIANQPGWVHTWPCCWVRPLWPSTEWVCVPSRYPQPLWITMVQRWYAFALWRTFHANAGNSMLHFHIPYKCF